MTYAEHLLAYKGYHDENYLFFSMHRRTAYEVYLSRPKPKGYTNLTIQKFMPLPIDDTKGAKSQKVIKEIHLAFLQKLEKENGRK